MSSPASHSEEPGRPIEPVAPSPSARAISSILGVIAGSGRGAGIGAAVGTCGCFLVLMASAVHDLVTGGGRGLTADTIVGALAVGAAWFGLISVTLGGIVGAFLGAMVGAFFPIRQDAR